MPEDQIIVKINPDVPPTGSDLGIVNAARKSFGRRSEWEEPFEGCDSSLLKLKDKDKRLLEFLARGMTADDFDEFCGEVECLGNEEYKEKLVEMLWQWRNTPTHDTPFNHGFFSFEVKAPIFVRAQLVKHESRNECENWWSERAQDEDGVTCVDTTKDTMTRKILGEILLTFEGK